MGSAFIEGWNFVEVLGEGAYGEVKLAVNDVTNTAVAVKIIRWNGDKQRSADIRKEVCIQKICNHDNIIRMYGTREDATSVYMLLEYASGGELFDRIEPDVGMDPFNAQRLFRQLMDAVSYLFDRGIAHRDLKPENLLFDDYDNLKVADFGLATIFRRQGVERDLDKCCGTYPYVAPEVLAKRPHKAQPADIWSCGVILVAMLAGELPWDQPSVDLVEYKSWTERKSTKPPFNKLDILSLSLLKHILDPNASTRFGIAEIKEHRWYKQRLTKALIRGKSQNNQSSPDPKRFRTLPESGESVISYSQPDMTSRSDSREEMNHNISSDHLASFSQPIDIDNMLLSQIPCTQGSSSQLSQTKMQRLVKRMTRFYVTADRDQAVDDLIRACIQLGYNQKKINAYTFSITTTDRRNSYLAFRVSLLDIDGLLLDFRLSKGDGIEFKRCFTKLKLHLDCLVNDDREPPMLSQC
ncbi:serine/threonine-protein kinase Chk1-like [Watersipora subatra]|uniref:serine/threonine-protein kinase Chk1-like n=1 Tax=Watersipora subatra TaxID=2589382 RepID=UPI00355B4E67